MNKTFNDYKLVNKLGEGSGGEVHSAIGAEGNYIVVKRLLNSSTCLSESYHELENLAKA